MAVTIPKSFLPSDVSRVFKSGAPARRGRTSSKPLACPFTIAVDTREQSPYSFATLHADSNHSYRPLVVATARQTLHQGDYSILSHTHAIAIERKSKQDLFGTLSAGRDRFEAELQRLSDCVIHSEVVVECELSEILNDPPEFSSLHPKTVIRSIIAWKQRFPSVHWNLLPGREIAEQYTFRVLERYWREFTKKTKGQEANDAQQ